MRRRVLSVFAALTLVGAFAPEARADPMAVLPGFDAVKPSSRPMELVSAPRALKTTYRFQGRTYRFEDYLRRSAQGIVVLDGDRIVKEWYAPGYSRDFRFQSWSVGKSYTSVAVGIALGEGRIRSLDDRVSRYVPELASSAYGDVSLRNLLLMSSGVAWDEVLNVPALHVGASMGWTSTLDFARTVRRGWKPGSRFEYTSVNSAVLALVLQRATGRKFFQYVQEKIWKPAGMASVAYVGNDSRGNGLGYCCFYSNSRDFARFGKMMLDGGAVNGRRVVSAGYVKAATTPSRQNPGYGLHWWIDGAEGYYASGLGDQTIYVSTRHRVVIARSTLFNVAEAETLPAFRALAAEVARTRDVRR